MSVFVLVLLLVIAAGLTYFELTFPKIGPAKKITIHATPAMISRGKYLANHVTMCMDCHSKRNWDKLAGPVISGTEGEGGEVFDKKDGLPGTFYAANITPAGIGKWTDGEVYRLLTTGVKKDGNVVFPVMPYLAFRKMAHSDIIDIIAYLRTLKPIIHKIPPSKADFPVNLIMKTIPVPASPTTMPSPSDTISYGKYLVTIADCSDCHTPKKNGQPINSLAFAGGASFPIPTGGTVHSANITPDSTTGIGYWSEEKFVDTFKKFDVKENDLPSITHDQYNTIMPWTLYAGMKKQDLRSIYRYLRTLKPIRHEVNYFTIKE